MSDNKQSMIRRFISYYRPHRRLFFLDMAMAVVRSACAIAITLITWKLFYAAGKPVSYIVTAAAVLLLLVILMSISTFINIKWGHILGTRIETDMRGELFRHLQKLSFSYFDKTKTGHIMARLSNDLFTVSEVAHHGPEDLLLSVCVICGAFISMFYINPRLALIALVPLPIMLGWGSFFQKRFRRRVLLMRKRVADINSNVENSIQGIREVKSFANEQHQENKFNGVNNDFRLSKESMYHTMAVFHGGMTGLISTHEILIVVSGAVMVMSGAANIADVLVFLMFARYMTKPIDRMVNFVEQFSQGAASFERFAEVMDIDPDIQDRSTPVEPTGIKGDISLNNLTFSYPGTDRAVLKELNIHIPAGSTVALVGESGAGKSTLAALIPRFYEADSGEILIDGCNVLDLRQKFLREHVGIVQQSAFIFDTTIRDNILFGSPDAGEDALIEAAKRANIYEFIMSLPEGFDSQVGEHGVKLSGGQKQRISIARVFLKNPPILIFDEATSSLDTESEQLIQNAMEDLCRNRTTIIIAHRLSTVKNASVTYVLKDGFLVEKGTHQELIDQKGYYHTLYTKSLF